MSFFCPLPPLPSSSSQVPESRSSEPRVAELEAALRAAEERARAAEEQATQHLLAKEAAEAAAEARGRTAEERVRAAAERARVAEERARVAEASARPLNLLRTPLSRAITPLVQYGIAPTRQLPGCVSLMQLVEGTHMPELTFLRELWRAGGCRGLQNSYVLRRIEAVDPGEAVAAFQVKVKQFRGKFVDKFRKVYNNQKLAD